MTLAINDRGSPLEGPGSPGQPWLPRSFVEQVEAWDTSRWIVFEWGTGWSTLWLASRCAHVYTVEHDDYWHRRITDAARERGLSNITFYKFASDITDGWARVTDPEAYARAIDAAGEAHGRPFDMVLIDGVVRWRCAELAVRHVGKVLAWDNAALDSGSKAMKPLDWEWRVAQWEAGSPPNSADTWYWLHPSFTGEAGA